MFNNKERRVSFLTLRSMAVRTEDTFLQTDWWLSGAQPLWFWLPDAAEKGRSHTHAPTDQIKYTAQSTARRQHLEDKVNCNPAGLDLPKHKKEKWSRNSDQDIIFLYSLCRLQKQDKEAAMNPDPEATPPPTKWILTERTRTQNKLLCVTMLGQAGMTSRLHLHLIKSRINKFTVIGKYSNCKIL